MRQIMELITGIANDHSICVYMATNPGDTNLNHSEESSKTTRT
jgi:hypothetical protein